MWSQLELMTNEVSDIVGDEPTEQELCYIGQGVFNVANGDWGSFEVSAKYKNKRCLVAIAEFPFNLPDSRYQDPNLYNPIEALYQSATMHDRATNLVHIWTNVKLHLEKFEGDKADRHSLMIIIPFEDIFKGDVSKEYGDYIINTLESVLL